MLSTLHVIKELFMLELIPVQEGPEVTPGRDTSYPRAPHVPSSNGFSRFPASLLSSGQQPWARRAQQDSCKANASSLLLRSRPCLHGHDRVARTLWQGKGVSAHTSGQRVASSSSPTALIRCAKPATSSTTLLGGLLLNSHSQLLDFLFNGCFYFTLL